MIHSAKGGTILNYLLSPITPLAITTPELPFTSDSGCFVRPKSSSFACIDTVRPNIDESP
jgi:hypothetical protein